MPHLYTHPDNALSVSRIIASGISPRGEYTRDALVSEAFLLLSERHHGQPIGLIVTRLRIDLLRKITRYNPSTGQPRDGLPVEVNPENGLPIEPTYCGEDDPGFEYIDNMDRLDSRIAETRLSQRQDEVISAWREGAEDCAEIAEKIGVSEGTVHTHRALALRKLRRGAA